MLTPVIEHALIERLAAGLPRSPLQLNKLQESDAEIVRLPPHSNDHITLSIDTIAEEIRAGVYADPWLIGWMSVMVNMSDLAAVGADPIGILISESIPATFSPDSLMRLQRGIGDACRACGTFVLGGDTNTADHLSITGCALGSIPEWCHLSRKGVQAGDILFSSGPLGAGNAFAFAQLTGRENGNIAYRPHARLAEGRLLRRFASGCMDTSDGLIATLDQLMRINEIGFSLEPGWEDSLDITSAKLMQHARIPEWLLLAGLHGEFELLFTIPPSLHEDFVNAAATTGWKPMRIGHAILSQELRIIDSRGAFLVDSGHIRNLGHTAASDFPTYLQSLLACDSSSR